MISVTSTTGNYILQPELIEKHTKTLFWLSKSMVWKSELTAFQKILEERAPLLASLDDKKRIDHFQNLIIYYQGEVIDALRKKLRDHETRLATMLASKNELDTQYYKDHAPVMSELDAFSNHFTQFRIEFLEFMQKTHRPDQ